MLQTWLDRTPRVVRTALVRAVNLYPPFVGAGICITQIAHDLSAFDVELRPRPWNRSLVGTHFGGSIYAMCDPFFRIALTSQLGPEYFVWDKTAQIDFRRPGRGTIRARFAISPAQVAAIRAQVAEVGKSEPSFQTDVIGPTGEVVATVHKQLWVKKIAARSESSHVQSQP
jgi:acyl-coenzyme A thioesterase PaaI-like protein